VTTRCLHQGESMSDTSVTRETSIEDLVRLVPESVGYLREQGIRCIRCGEPIWGSLEEAAKEKGFGEEDIDRFVRELNAL
jgi:methionine synthase II (cobalamin-independent)